MNSGITKALLFGLVVAACLALGADEKAPDTKELILLHQSSEIVLRIDPVGYLFITCGGGYIQIDYKTGAVKLPENVKLDETAVKFWLAVAKAFPDARRQIVGDERKP
jgi:hypothetical protein